MQVIQEKNRIKWYAVIGIVGFLDLLSLVILLSSRINIISFLALVGFWGASAICFVISSHTLQHKIEYNNNVIVFGGKDTVKYTDITQMDIIKEDSLELKIVTYNNRQILYPITDFELSEVLELLFYCSQINTEIDTNETTIDILEALSD